MKIIQVLLLCLLTPVLRGQSTCVVYQYMGKDSTSSHAALTIRYNERSQKTEEVYSDYKKTESEGTDDGTYNYFYRDTFLVRRTWVSATGDCTKTIYHYNEKNQLAKEETFEFKSLYRNSGYLQPGAATPRQWQQTSLIQYTYDYKGNRTVYDATVLHWSAQNLYRWEYDDKNRVVKQTSYARSRMIWKEDYQYYDWGYRFFRTWYDEEGNPRHLNTESYSYWPLFVFQYTLDKQGRLIEEKISDEKSNLHGRTEYYYGKNSKLSKTIYYNSKDQPAITHIYQYTQL